MCSSNSHMLLSAHTEREIAHQTLSLAKLLGARKFTRLSYGYKQLHHLQKLVSSGYVRAKLCYVFQSKLRPHARSFDCHLGTDGRLFIEKLHFIII